MAQRTVRLNLKASAFPLLSEFGGDAIMVRQNDDSDYVITDAYSGALANRDIGIPMPNFMENVLPTAEGLQGIGVKQQIADYSTVYKQFDQIFLLRNANENNTLYVPGQGQNFVYGGTGGWASNPFATFAPQPVTVAYVQQHTYIHYANLGTFEWDPTTSTFNPVVLAGLTAANILGIAAADGKLIAYTFDTIFWSSAIAPLDFVPSLSSGAGSQKVNEVRGAILAVFPITGGFIIYTSANAVAGIISGNIRFPFTFKEVVGSQGIAKHSHVCYKSNYEAHFVWTKGGLQQVDKQKAVPFFPEISDFLKSRTYELFVGSPFQLQLAEYAAKAVRLNFVGTRFLAISYGEERIQLGGHIVYDYVLVYDFGLKRWGKIAFKHVDVFELTVPVPSSWVNGDTFALLQDTGRVVTINFARDVPSTINPVLIFGRLHHMRNRHLTLEHVDIEGNNPNFCNLEILPAYDGKNWGTPVIPFPALIDFKHQVYNSHVTSKSHYLKFRGAFNLVSLNVTLHDHGLR